MLHSDKPTNKDELGFEPTATALYDLIIKAKDDTPLTIGVFGEWGSGKTSLMKMVYHRFLPTEEQEVGQSEAIKQSILPIWFDAWRYNQADVLWRTLVLKIIDAIRDVILADDDRSRTLLNRVKGDQTTELRNQFSRELDDLAASLYRTVDREELGQIQVDWPKAGKAALGTGVRLGLAALPLIGPISSMLTKVAETAQGKLGELAGIEAWGEVIQRERTRVYRDQIRQIDQFYEALGELIQQIKKAGMTLVIFIDDLDRCLPEQAIGVIEAIKVVLDYEGCIFALGMDREIIEHGIRVHYSQFALDADEARRGGATPTAMPVEQRNYLEKIIQVPLELPPVSQTAMERFIRDRLKNLMNEENQSEVATLFLNAIRRNPRKIKRALSAFSLILMRADHDLRQSYPVHLAKLFIIQHNFPSVFKEIVNETTMLNKLEQSADTTNSQHQPIINILSKQKTNLLANLDKKTIRSLIFSIRPD